MDSILTSVKNMLGIAEEYEHFDSDLITHINSVFMILTQLGVGPLEGFFIHDSSSTWSDFLSDGKADLVRSYMYLKVRMLFDPPESSAAIEATKQQINEFEWRLMVHEDPVDEKRG